ncbi:hypothetical protein J8A87_08455 [Vibrio parahaemolyticus]|uniref:hypothetical protein n=1 Tax=Vibrio parahaemolyticus TaxID=670 RepID=UPI0004D50857|nr:hypothetical protein [Vibrio parahaemolyticus]EGR0768298.1 hypothetical protein [Vibrio parahaemolyticus]EGR0837821.1 hypothetical protein [Vibrio parahaemolyticus]EJG1272115.1 hypothetical protein [Vibrio parahaemolyticus]MCF9164500.1 hypothetical protein [Vibrio parahaemolyticus]MCF9177999.1 hypothetical protein [Vibrio parahaemolyticus]
MTLNDLLFIVWKDATVANNEVHGVVQLDEMDLLTLIREAFERKAGLEAKHVELCAITNEPEAFYPELKRFKLIGDDEQ